MAASQFSAKVACRLGTAPPSTRSMVSRQTGWLRDALEPLVGDAGAADEADAAVDDEELAVGAVVELEDAIPGGRVVEGDLAAGVEERGEVALADAGAAEGVEHDVDADAGAGAFGEGIEVELADLAALEDVGLEVDAVAGALRMASSSAG